ncbi:MAG: hypothetical protein H0T89_13700, partial [Deltaproteobacteria bacterium]|nr:hypothetical protein [Deltaproteobacteria bacterium]
ASRRLELARERACDAWALEANEVSRPAYARLLLQMAQLRVAAASPLAAPHALDARIAAVLGPTARPRLGIVHRLALVAWALVALGGARTAVAEGKPPICVYTPALAEAIRQAYPDADADGDGVLSRDEACDYQAELRRHAPEPAPALQLDEARTPLLEEPLCCNCGDSAGLSGPLPSSTEASCLRDEEGVSR